MNNIVLRKMTFDQARQCADEIKSGISNIGKKLLELHDGDGWEILGYASWRECAMVEFGYSQSYAYRLLSLEEVKQNLIDFSPIGENTTPVITESQARHLATIPAEEQPIVYQLATATAPNGKITAAHVEQTVKEYKAEQQAIASPSSQQVDEPSDTEQSTFRYTLLDEGGGQEDYAIPPGHTLIVSVEKNGEDSSPEKHDSDEYYTPAYIIDAARSVLGEIDLDPASCELAQSVVQADDYYNKKADGLNKPWFGNVWLNPPFSKPEPFVSKMIEEYEAGNVDAAIVLTNNGTETKWGQALLSRYPVCFVGASEGRRSRISFWKETPDEPEPSNRYAQMIFYLGKDTQKFCNVFSQFGPILEKQ